MHAVVPGAAQRPVTDVGDETLVETISIPQVRRHSASIENVPDDGEGVHVDPRTRDAAIGQEGGHVLGADRDRVVALRRVVLDLTDPLELPLSKRKRRAPEADLKPAALEI